jgi:ABC-type nitrate/sulfonate/bicarbonate transport system substrate-binding protein
VTTATERGYEFAFEHPAGALDDLVASVPSLDRGDQAAQLRALGRDLRPAPFDRDVLEAWASWDLEHGLLKRPLHLDAAFRLSR